MRWFKRAPNPPPPVPASPPQADAFMSLITALAEQSAKRYQAQLEHEAKLEEFSLKRHEIEVQNSELLARAEAARKAAQEDLRQRRANSGRLSQQKFAKSRAIREMCPVCDNPGNPLLSAIAIQWHHSGHPNGQLPLEISNGATKDGG